MTTEPNQSFVISRVTRREILDFLVFENYNWSGRLRESDFLQRIIDLFGLPSNDDRFPDAFNDVLQHRDSWQDWPDDWYADDPRLNLLGCPSSVFAAFLEEAVNPRLRPGCEQEVEKIVTQINHLLTRDGVELILDTNGPGYPHYEIRTAAARGASVVLDPEHSPRLENMHVLKRQLGRIERDIETDPWAAIGSSKELVETVCKTILDDYGVEYKNTDDFQGLYNKVAEVLKLKAEAVPNDNRGSKAAVKSLRSLGSVVRSLAELRNQLGTGHGSSTLPPAEPRHARLAFNAAMTVCEFLVETWHKRRRDEEITF